MKMKRAKVISGGFNVVIVAVEFLMRKKIEILKYYLKSMILPKRYLEALT